MQREDTQIIPFENTIWEGWAHSTAQHSTDTDTPPGTAFSSLAAATAQFIAAAVYMCICKRDIE